MQDSSFPADIAIQAEIVNRFAGSLQAWKFLVRQGYDHREIFEFLIDKDGPECAQPPIKCARRPDSAL